MAVCGCAEWRLLLMEMHGLLTAVASLLWNTGSRHVRLQAAWAQQWWCAGLVAPLHEEPSQTRWNPCPQHWQADSYPPNHQRRPLC